MSFISEPSVSCRPLSACTDHFTPIVTCIALIERVVVRSGKEPEALFWLSYYRHRGGVIDADGLWSAFQTFGANHPKYMPAVSVVSIAAGIIVALGFGLLPILIALRY